MRRKNWSVLFLVGLLIAVAGSETLAANAPEPLPPFTGVIRNYTPYDVAIPSANSSATIIVPARGWVEYTVWSPRFDLIGYVKGDPFDCQKVQAIPRSVTFQCKNYDFLAEIRKPELERPPVRIYKKLKKRIKRRV